MIKEINKRSRISTFMKRGSLILFLLLLLITAALLIYLNIKKNDISEKLLTAVNKELKGDFTVGSISLGSLYAYPDLKVSIRGLKFHAPSGPRTDGELILEVKSIQLTADLTDVFSKKIQIDHASIIGARLYIERDSLEQMVISEGFQPINPTGKKTDSTNLSVHINDILIKNSQVLILDRPTGIELPFNLKQVTGTFELKNDLIKGEADINMDSIDFEQTKALFINGLSLHIFTAYSVDLERRKVLVNADRLDIGDEIYGFNYDYDYTDKPSMNLWMSSGDEGVNLATLFVEEVDTIKDNQKIELLGHGQFTTDLHWRPDSDKSFFQAIKARFVLEGKDLNIYGIDLDKVIDKFKKSQKFNLADVGAVMFAGPAGLAVTKGTDFARLAFSQAGDSTEVKHFLADWKMEHGVLSTQDVAVSTRSNLVSTDGWYNIKNDSLDFKISVLDKRGCDLIGQRIYGTSQETEYGNVKLLKAFFGPVKNFFRDIGFVKCDTIYTGKVVHPNK